MDVELKSVEFERMLKARRLLSKTAAYAQGSLSAVDRLLLEIHENLEEPDGIYAIARSDHIQMQSSRFAHEGVMLDSLSGDEVRAYLLGISP